MHSGNQQRPARRDDTDTADYGIDTVAANIVHLTIRYAQWFQRPRARVCAGLVDDCGSCPRATLCQVAKN